MMIPPGLAEIRGLVLWVGAATAAAVMLAWLLVIVFPTYRYSVADRVLTVQRLVLGRVLLGGLAIRLDDLEAYESSGFGWVPPTALPYGRPLARQGVLLTVRSHKRRRKIYITPEHSSAFVAEIESLTGIAPRTGAMRVRTPLEYLPLWVADCLALLSAICTPAILGFSPELGESSLGSAVVLVGAVLMLTMVLLMMLDCYRGIPFSREDGATFWLVAVIFFFPSAWLYYALICRPRRLGRGSNLRR